MKQPSIDSDDSVQSGQPTGSYGCLHLYRLRRTIQVAVGFAFLLCFPLSSNLQARSADRTSVLDGIQIPPLDFTPPPVDSRDLTGYATLYRLQDDTLPVVHLRIIIEGGEDLEEVKEAGNLSAMAALLQSGGAGKLSPEEMASRLALLGASISTSVSDQTWEIQLSAMREDFLDAFSLLELMLSEPSFNESSLGTIKNQMISSIRSRLDSPDTIGFLKLSEIMYPGTRRGHSLNEEDVNRISVQSVRNTYSARLKQARYHIALDGNFQGLGLEKRLVDLLRKLPVPTRPLSLLPDNAFKMPEQSAVANPYKGKIVHVTGDFAQSLLIVASPSVAHNDPDFYTLQLGNHILGGGSFTSRLMQEIRVKRGLAYYAYSYNRSQAASGFLAAVSATRSERAAETLTLMLQLLESMKNQVSENDLEQARTAILNSLVFLYDNPAEILADQIRFRIDEMPENYLNQFPERLKEVKASGIKEAFSRYLKRDDLFIVVVGPPSLAKDLRNIAPVITMDAAAKNSN
ncbi:MAG: insulinase family protein [Leptospiraceae bacterium]|nr:insulinase family protein [Leptospiraceae bacterium]